MKLHLRETSGGQWIVSAGGALWSATPRFPEPSELMAQRWLAEEAGSAPADEAYWSSVLATQGVNGRRLWDSIVCGAPDPSILHAQPVSELVIDPLDGASEPWSSLIDARGVSPILEAQRCFFPLASKDRGGSAAQHKVALRILLITSRPQGRDDVPLLNVLLPLAQLADENSAEIHIAGSPTKSEVGRIVGTAAESGKPYTAIIFDGHGAADGSGRARIAFESALGVTSWLSPADFAKTLAPAMPPLIVLAACRTGYSAETLTSSASFAAELATFTGSNVIGMAHNIEPETARIFVTALFSYLWDGTELDIAVQDARRVLASKQPSSQDWRAPVLYHSHPLSFQAEAHDPDSPSPPQRILRAIECADALRSLRDRPVRLLIGPKRIGKTRFLEELGWLLSLQGGRPSPVRIDAREVAAPDLAILGASGDALHVRPMVLIDNAEAWAQCPSEAWNAFLEHARKLRQDGGGVVMTSAEAIECLVAYRDVSADWFLGFGESGFENALDRASVLKEFFPSASAQDPWLTLVSLVTRCEPVLLEWAAQLFQSGVDAEDIFWRFILVSESDGSDIVRRLGDVSILADLPPMLGWAFGVEGSALLAELESDQGCDPVQAQQLWRQIFREARSRRLGIERTGGQIILSASHSAILRSRAPIGTWPVERRARYAAFFRYLSVLVDHPDMVMPECVYAFSKRPWAMTGGATRKDQQTDRNRYVSLLSILPQATVAAHCAMHSGDAQAAAEICAGYPRIFQDFDLVHCSDPWLRFWRNRSKHASAGQEDAQQQVPKLFTSESVRSGVFDGKVTFGSYIAASGMSDGLSTAASLLGEVRSLIATGQTDGPNELWRDHVHQFLERAGLFSASEMMDPELDDGLGALSALLPKGDWFAQHFTLEAIRYTFALQHNRFQEAERTVDRILRIADPNSAMDQNAVAVFACEVYAMTRLEPPIKWALQALRTARVIGNRFSIALAQFLLSTCYKTRGEMGEARRLCIEARRNLQEQPLVDGKATLHLAMIAAVDRNPWLAEAYRARAEQIALSHSLNNVFLEALALAPIFAVQTGRHEEADRVAERLGKESERHGFEHGLGISKWFAADRARREERPDEAIELATQALSLLRPQPLLPFIGHCHRIIAEAYSSQQRFAEAAQAQHRAAIEFDRNNYGEEDPDSDWLLLEFYALASENEPLAQEAAAHVKRTGIGNDIRVPLLLFMCAGLWMDAHDYQLAQERAKAALADPTLLEPHEREMAEFLASMDLGGLST